ncbi:MULTISPECIES: FUSC family membrane protein [unclassified Agarivorans]|uniref:FUSC family membrane protein n=1 Tax=unclassified Agarivorans TaxID=2636026 RepID=UPI0026E3A7E9|nr:MULTISPECIES: FUSC family membrane protein [unclassified Agarivorans]MDO6684990.1 FUSC family membrane protein [Agarivorans sp. 3_MG-2023]MDO6714849.1 FUSC family membrane protein [Agarivorans sp. 2_MG-2023]
MALTLKIDSSALNWTVALKAAGLATLVLSLGLLLDVDLALTATLGIVAAGLADSPDFYQQRLQSTALMVTSFTLATVSVTLLFPWPWLFAVGLFSSCYLFMRMPVLGQKYGSISLCSLIIAIYTMLGYSTYANPWVQPLWLVIGALSYALLSLVINALYPTRWVDKQLDNVFRQISLYQLTKTRLFQRAANINDIQVKLTAQSADIAEQLGVIRHGLYVHQQRNKQQVGSSQMDRFFKAQLLHERLSSSHLDYERLQKVLPRTLLAETRTILVKIARVIGARQTPPEIEQELNYAIDTLEQNRANLKDVPPRFAYMLKNLKKVTALCFHEQHFPEPEQSFSPFSSISIKQYLQQAFDFTLSINRHALRMATIMLAAYGLIQLSGDEHAYWLMLSCLLVVKPNYHDTKKRVDKRVYGTIVGVVLAAGLSYLALPEIILIALLPGFILLFFLFFHFNYAISVAVITVFVAMSLDIQGYPANEALMVRTFVTILGAVMAMTAMRYLWPDWQHKQSRKIISQLFANIAKYQQAIFEQYFSQATDESTAFRLSRYHAYQSEAELVRHWQHMLAEPSAKQRLSPDLYQLVGLSHHLLSHLSALSTHRNQLQSSHAAERLASLGETIQNELCLMHDYLLLKSEQRPSLSLQHEALMRAINQLLPQLVGNELLIAYQLQLIGKDLKKIRQLLLNGKW